MPPTKKRIGRPPAAEKLTPEVQRIIVEAVGALAPRKTAAARAGISERTLHYWIAKGKKAKPGTDYAAFLAAVKKAEAEALIVRIARIGRAAQGGQVVERTTVTTTKQNKDGTSTTTAKTFEKVAPGQWTADAWALERRDPDNYALNRKKEIEDAVKAAVEKALGAKPLHPSSGPA